MPNRVASAVAQGTSIEAGKSLARDLRAGLGGQTPAFALVFASTKQPLDTLMPVLAEGLGSPVWLGASTAGEFTERGDVKGGVTAVAIAGDFRAYAGMGHGLKANPMAAVQQALAALPAKLEGFPHRTVVMLVDPLSGAGEEATLIAAALLGDGARLAGGAAGDDLAMKSTQIALGEKVASDAVVLAAVFSKAPAGSRPPLGPGAGDLLRPVRGRTGHR
jgi:methyl-accepting chemotaxis protein